VSRICSSLALLAALAVCAGCGGPPGGRSESSAAGAQDAEVALSPAERAAAAFGAGVEAELAGDRDGAAECYRRAAELCPDEAGFEARLGLVLSGVPELAAEGAAHLERAEALGARDFAVHQTLATHYLGVGRKDRAAGEFEKLLACAEAAADPERFEPVAQRVAFFLVSHYQGEGQPEKAARVYGALIRSFPDRAELRLERAKLLLAAGDEPGGRSDVAAYEKLEPASPAGARLLAVHFSRKGNAAEALVETERAIARLKAGGDPDDRPGDASAMRHFRAELLGRLKRFEEARRELDDLLACAPDDGERVDALVALAYLDRAAGLGAQAEKRLRAALDGGIKSARLHAALAEALAGSGQPGEAAESWRRAQDLAPKDNYYRLALAALLEKQLRRPAAAAELRAALENRPDDPAALNMLGYLYAQEGINLDEAAELVSRALAADPKNGHYLDSLGWVRYRQGRVEEALALLERAALAVPEAVVYEHLGDACYALGLNHRARSAWRKALELDKDSAAVERKLQRIGGGR